jgi:hypothetical protein
MNENGKASSKKVFKLFSLLFSLIKQLIFYRPNYVYYPPSGPEFVPVVRDFALLSIIRVFGKKIIFHFHAGEFPEIYPNLNGFLKKVFNFCYRKSEYVICLNIAGTKYPKISVITPSYNQGQFIEVPFKFFYPNIEYYYLTILLIFQIRNKLT